MSSCTIDSYIFPRATTLEVEQDVKNNLEKLKKKNSPRDMKGSCL